MSSGTFQRQFSKEQVATGGSYERRVNSDCRCDPICRLALAMVVQRNRFSVVSVANVGETLEVAVHAQPALIFTDLMTPVMDDYQTT